MTDLRHKYPAPESKNNSRYVFSVEGGVTFPLMKHEPEVADLIEDLAKVEDPSELDTNN